MSDQHDSPTKPRTLHNAGWGLAALVVVGIVVALIWYFKSGPPPTPGDVGGKSLWIASEVPQVGTIVRLSFKDSEHKIVASTTYYDNALSALYTPVTAGAFDEDLNLDDKADVDLGLKFLAKGAPTVDANTKGARSLSLKIRGERAVQWVSLTHLQNFLRGVDGGKAPTAEIHSLMSTMNDAGDLQRKTQAMTPYWIVTKVFSAKSVEYSTDSSKGLLLSAKCGGKGAPCVIPAVELTTKLDLQKDTQHVVSGDDRPIFVVVKPVGTNGKGVFYIEEADAPTPIIRD